MAKKTKKPDPHRPLEFDEGVTAGDFDPPGLEEALKRGGPAKLRITTMIDEDIYDELKRRAGGGGYQTLLNKILRDALFIPSMPVAEFTALVKEAVEDLLGKPKKAAKKRA